MSASLSQRAARRALSALLVVESRRAGRSLRRNDRGDALDAGAQALLGLLERQAPRGALRPVGVARHEYEVFGPILDVPFVELARVEDRRIPGPGGDLPVRIYTPPGGGSRPILVWFHGGGWVLGSLGSHDGVLRHLAKSTGAIVVSVDYRLAPEHRFPAGSEDAVFATRFVLENARALGGDPARVGVGGDSAGGNLAATTCLALRDLGGARPSLQILVYPATDLRRTSDSHRTLGDGYFLTRDLIEWFVSRYVRTRADEADPTASPLLAADLSGLPPAFVFTAGFDPLRDEGEAYASRLAAAGVPTVTRGEPHLFHGYLAMGGVLPAAREAVDAVAAAIVRGFDAPAAAGAGGARPVPE